MKTQGIQLQELIDECMALAHSVPISKKTPSEFAAVVLDEFDRLYEHQIDNDFKLLSGGETAIADTSLPAGFQRSVIKEALADLNILQIVQTLTDFQAGITTEIPYEGRDASAVPNDAVVYEGNPIPRANISQEMAVAYVLPMKLAFMISNEVMHFSKTSPINWDAYARNVESNARLVREMLARRIANEMQRAADAYGALNVAGETFDAQLTGANSIIKTALFPIVRQFQERDLKGTAIGTVENPISMVFNDTTLEAYNGTGTQTAGTYYRIINYNLGYVQLVNESGTPVTPSDSGTNTISYSHATNVTKVDTDLGSLSVEKRMNDIIIAIGSRKAIMLQDRLVAPDFLLMSPILNDQVTNAEMFTTSGQTNSTNTNLQGDLETVKGIPAWGTNLPGVDLGEERIIMGQRSTLSYSLAKPFVTGAPFEVLDTNGKPVGKKQAYGEEYSAIKVPEPIRGRLTSVLAFSFTGR